MGDDITEAQAFGLALRARRERAKLSQESLANLAGLHRTYVGGVERGERNLSLRNIHALANALATTASAILAHAERIRSGKRPSLRGP
jgi:transcriptional regulator with XRE-family HTH domain